MNTVIKLETASAERPPVLNIRAARPGDLRQLLDMIALHAECHGDDAKVTASDLDRDLFGTTPWVTAVVAEAGGQLVGYAILVPLYRALEGRRGMELHQIFVREGHRGSGIGRHLVSRAREQARIAGCSYLSVSAATGNFGAHRFYEEMNFKAGPVTGMRYMQALS
ncbi:GNAT family N-acetyltransferase [Mycoplana rhizolycopersici]|jgi:GNAT superfamily N-acetyltransferase|uniref:GNAT family N-acetyltransferase n=1 Tax=Mycoplana rhizolycopersici TaxID=2746702 RepID=A0ABX2QIA8_9HYPH|nr:GNAT family N-acetyltransferase [Rhizobium rhizolycopersici]NVP57500.1 GNAT family N-acetyltransferase [Rhizobium rhizolycopersici]